MRVLCLLPGILAILGCGNNGASTPAAKPADGKKAVDESASKPVKKEPVRPTSTKAEGEVGETLQYVYLRMRNQPADAAREKKSLADDIGVDTLDVAEMIHFFLVESNFSQKVVSGFLKTPAGGIPTNEVPKPMAASRAAFANLVERIGILHKDFTQKDRALVLRTGLAGDVSAVGRMPTDLTVGFLVTYFRKLDDYCRAQP